MHHTSVLTLAVGLSLLVAFIVTPSASAQQLMWKDNPIAEKVVGLTYGTSCWYADAAEGVAFGGHRASYRSHTERDWRAPQVSSVWSAHSNGTARGLWFGLKDASHSSNWAYPSGVSAACDHCASGPGSSEAPGTTEDHGLLAFGSASWSRNEVLQSVTSGFVVEVAQCPLRSWSWPQATDPLQAQGARQVVSATMCGCYLQGISCDEIN